MSLHKSLIVNNKLRRARNVLTRAERIARLAEEGRYVPGDPVYGLPKVRTIVKARGKKKKKKKAAEESE